MRIAAISVATLLLFAEAVHAQVKASPPSGVTQAPRPGPIEVVFRTFGTTITRRALTDPVGAIAEADSAMNAAYAEGNIPRAVAYRFFRNRQQVRGRDIQAGLADMESVLVASKQMRDTVMIARVWASRGHGNQLLGKFDEAMHAFTQGVRFCRATQFPTLEGFCHRGMAYITKSRGQLDEARRHCELAIAQVANNSQEYLTCRLMLGEIDNRQGKYDDARTQFQSVLEESRNRNDKYSEIAALWDLASQAYDNGDNAAADRNWGYAASVYDSLRDIDGAINAQLNRVRAMVDQERHDEALGLLDGMLQRAEKAKDPLTRLSVQATQGQVYRRIGRVEQAERTLRVVRAETVHRDELEHDRATCELAALLTDIGRPGEVDALIDSLLAPSRGVEISVPDRAYAWMAKSRARRAMARSTAALNAAREAERLARIGRKDGSFEWLDASIELGIALREAGRPDSAIVVFANAARVWERLRSQISSLEWRERYGAGLSGLFAEYGQALLDPRRKVAEPVRVRQAFDALQAFQARTLEERMHATGLSARAMTRRVTADSLSRKVLRPGEALVDLVATPDTTFAFVVTTRGVEARRLSGTKRMGRLYEDWRGAMLGGATASTVEAGLRRLSDELLGSLAATLAGSKRVVVSGGGELMLWPTAALTLPGETAPLGATREVVTTPSATLFAIMRARGTGGAAAPALLALGRTTTAEGRELPGAERELRALADYAGVTVRQNKGDRTVAQLTSDLAKWDALHFAAHSEADATIPWRSGFLLGEGTNDDAYLRASSIARMKLKARLAVLSGCSSAGVTTLAGEGALGLSSGFLCAGTPSVIATLWPVDDRTAERFMDAFYRALASGATTASAANEARNALRAQSATENPREWAAFVVVGEPGTKLPLKKKTLFGVLELP